jgi:hypothetical protein
MPRYHFNLYNDLVVPDDEGTKLPNKRAAQDFAVTSIRELIGAEAAMGHIDLTHRIDVTDDCGKPLFTVRFADAVSIKM